MRRYTSLLFAFLLAGCASEAPEDDLANAIMCTDPRPQMCTRDYRPVCGTRDADRKTYGNGCEACADAAVRYHTPGPCEADK